MRIILQVTHAVHRKQDGRQAAKHYKSEQTVIL